MKAWMLGVAALLVAGLSWADATVTSLSGTVSAGTRTVRLGDQLRAGEIVSTAKGSSAVLRFEDGQVVVLGQNSRMEIQQYDYNAQAKTGNIGLRLLNGAMRAITGLIGQNSPKNVTYKAGLYTIGIRGTDVTIVTDQGNVLVTVEDGLISVTVGTRTFTVRAGEGVNARTDGTFQQGAIATILQQLGAMPGGQAMIDALGGVQGISVAVGQAASGQSGTISGTPGPGSPGGSGGGGTASKK